MLYNIKIWSLMLKLHDNACNWRINDQILYTCNLRFTLQLNKTWDFIVQNLLELTIEIYLNLIIIDSSISFIRRIVCVWHKKKTLDLDILLYQRISDYKHHRNLYVFLCKCHKNMLYIIYIKQK